VIVSITFRTYRTFRISKSRQKKRSASLVADCSQMSTLETGAVH
jgi:hypothetical protein